MNMQLLILILLSSISTLAYGLNDDSIRIKNNYYQYKINNIDTIVTHYQNNTKENNKTIDSIKIKADIIIENLPLEIDSVDITIQVIEIMRINNVNICYVFRDLFSSHLFRMSSSYASDLLDKKKGFLGEFKN